MAKDLNARLEANIRAGLKNMVTTVYFGECLNLAEAMAAPWQDETRPRLDRSAWEPLLETVVSVQAAQVGHDMAALSRNRCQSEVEELFLMAVMAVGAIRHHEIVYPWPYKNLGPRCCASPSRRVFPETLFICPQHVVGRMHVDFLLTFAFETYEPTPAGERGERLWSEVRLVVECDGHDFHEKTKEQARKDKKRDRELQKLGFRLFRYTGSEVWADPIAVATEALDTLRQMSVESVR